MATEFESHQESQIKTLEEVCTFKKGAPLEKSQIIDGPYPIIGCEQTPMGYHNEFNHPENTIICASFGEYAGLISRYTEKVFLTDCFSISPKNMDILNENYLYYYLKNIYSFKTCSDLEKLKIPIPSLETQQKIIDEIEQKIEIHKVKSQGFKLVIEALEDEKQIFMKTIFRKYRVQTLKEVCELINGTKKNNRDGKIEGLYPLYHCSTFDYLYLDTFDYDGEGIIINKTNESDKVIIHYGYNKYNIGESIIHFKSNNNDIIMTKYIYHYLMQNIHKLEDLYKDSAQKSIKINNLPRIKIPIISLEKQQLFIDYCENYLKKIKQYENSIEQYKIIQNDYIKSLFDFGNNESEEAEEEESENEESEEVEQAGLSSSS